MAYISNLWLNIKRGRVEQVRSLLTVPNYIWGASCTLLQVYPLTGHGFTNPVYNQIITYFVLLYGIIVIFIIFPIVLIINQNNKTKKDSLEFFSIQQLENLNIALNYFFEDLKKSKSDRARKAYEFIFPIAIGVKNIDVHADNKNLLNTVEKIENEIIQHEFQNKISNLLESRKKDILEWDDIKENIRFPVNSPHLVAFDRDINKKNILDLDIKVSNADYLLIKNITEIFYKENIKDIPYTIGAGGFLVYKKEKKIILHCRNNNKNHLASEHAGKYHLFSGNFEPNVGLQGCGYDENLYENAQREIKEESGVTAHFEHGLYFIYKEHAENDIINTNSEDWRSKRRFLATSFFGVSINEQDFRRIKKSKNDLNEGSCKDMSLLELEKALQTEKWVTAGWVSIMLWLYIGAPCYDGEYVFNKRKARNTALRVLGLKEIEWYNKF